MGHELKGRESFILERTSVCEDGYTQYQYKGFVKEVFELTELFSQQLWSPDKAGVICEYNLSSLGQCTILIPSAIDVRLIAYLIYTALNKNKIRSSSGASPKVYEDPNQYILDELEREFGISKRDEAWGNFPAPENLVCCEDIVERNSLPIARRGKRSSEKNLEPVRSSKRRKTYFGELTYSKILTETYAMRNPYIFKGDMTPKILAFVFRGLQFIRVSTLQGCTVIEPGRGVDVRLVAYFLYLCQVKNIKVQSVREHDGEKQELDPNRILLNNIQNFGVEVPAWYTNSPQPGAIFARLPISEELGSQTPKTEPAVVAASASGSAVMPGARMPVSLPAERPPILKGRKRLVLKCVPTNAPDCVAYSFSSVKCEEVNAFWRLFSYKLWSPNKAGIICTIPRAHSKECTLLIPKKVNVHLVAYLIYVALNKEILHDTEKGNYYFDYTIKSAGSGKEMVEFSEKNYVPVGPQRSFSVRKSCLLGKLSDYIVRNSLEAYFSVVRDDESKILTFKGSKNEVLNVLQLNGVYYHKPLPRFDDPNEYLLQELGDVFGLEPDYQHLSSRELTFLEELVCCENVLEQSATFESAAAASAPILTPLTEVTTTTATTTSTTTTTTTTTTLPDAENNLLVGEDDLNAVLGGWLPDELVNISESSTGVAQSGFFSQRDEDEFVRDIDSWLKGATPGNG